MKDITIGNGILRSTKQVEQFKTYVLIHDTVDGWSTYKVPNFLYQQFQDGKLSYWDMIQHKKTKEV